MSVIELPASYLPSLKNSISDVQLAGDYAYVTFGASGLYIFDVSDVRQPKLVSKVLYEMLSNIDAMVVAGNKAYVATDRDFYIFDMGDPLALFPISSVKSEWYLDIERVGSMVYLFLPKGEVVVLDTEGEHIPQVVGLYDFGQEFDEITMNDSYFYLLDRVMGVKTQTLYIFEGVQPYQFKESDQYVFDFDYFSSMAAHDDILYVSGIYESRTGQVFVLEVIEPLVLVHKLN